jgi:hypothetical protein
VTEYSGVFSEVFYGATDDQDPYVANSWLEDCAC